MSDTSPDFFERDGKSVWIYGSVGVNGPRIARVQFGLNYGQDIYTETLANARLIAAAPELYEALDKLIKVCIEQGFAVGPHGRVAIGMDALRKARGES